MANLKVCIIAAIVGFVISFFAGIFNSVQFHIIFIRAIFSAILFFGLIIFIHEFGHFIFAKLFGVKVNEFAIGMGPTIFKKQGKETKYALRLFPIGGFVSMEGEEEESEDSRAFCNQKTWKRMIIIAAGATLNIILGIIICFFLVGSEELVGTKRNLTKTDMYDRLLVYAVFNLTSLSFFDSLFDIHSDSTGFWIWHQAFRA